MKVSVDGLIGSARKINSQRQQDENNSNKKKNQIQSDSVAITAKVNTRLDSIESEFKEIQSSLTKNQIIRNGIEQLELDLSKGGENQNSIYEEITFEGNKVLESFIGERAAKDVLTEKLNAVNEMVNDDANRLKRLQVEVDNIMASNLAGTDKVENIMSDINSLFADIETTNLEAISSLRPDAVMRLIK